MSIDFDALEEGSGQAFKSALKSIPRSLSTGTVNQFFDTVINVLDNENVELENKSRILISLCQTISEDDYLNDFVSGKYLTKLPYDDKNLQVQLFDVLYIVASSSPLSLTKEVSQKLENILPASPRRALGVLTVYAKNFDAVKKSNWQYTLDLLTKPETSDIFKTRLYVKDYVSLLCLLCEKQQYRKEKINDAWDAICSCLTVNRDESVCLCYYGLDRLFDKGYVKQGQCQFPSTAVACHLRRHNCQSAALSLLMRLQPNGEENGASDVINSLVWAAHTDLNANLVLVQLAKDESLAQSLVRDAAWMVQELPTKVDTMRLFAVVLSHENLIEDISKKNEAFAFLRSSLELDTPGVLSAVTTFTRRFRIDPDLAKFCSDYGLLSTYFQYALERKDKTSIDATLLFIHTFANVSYSHDLLQACDYVSDLIRNSKKDRDLMHAARVACDLAQYPKCAARFQNLKLDDYFIDNQDDPKIKKAGAHFMQALKKASKQEQRNANRPKESSTKLVASRTYRPDPSEKNPQDQSKFSSSRLLSRNSPVRPSRIENEDKRSTSSKNSQYKDQDDKRSTSSRNSQNRDQDDKRSTSSKNSQYRDQDDKKSTGSRHSRIEDIEEIESIGSKNNQPAWVVDENSSNQNQNSSNLIFEEEEENSFESSTQLVVVPSKKDQSDTEEYDNDELPFTKSRSNKPLPKPPSPRRSRE